MPKKSNEVMYESELARLLGLNARTVQRQRQNGTLPFNFVRVGCKTLYSRSSVMASLEKGTGNVANGEITQTTKK
jgi:hypothetical protein